jgi:hypothetical protein
LNTKVCPKKKHFNVSQRFAFVSQALGFAGNGFFAVSQVSQRYFSLFLSFFMEEDSLK